MRWEDFTPTDTTGTSGVIYSGTNEDLSTDTGKIDFITKLKNYYASTDLINDTNFDGLHNIDPATDTNAAISLANTYVQTDTGGIGGNNVALANIGDNNT